MTTLKIQDGKALEAFLKLVAADSVSKALANLKQQGSNKQESVIKEEDDMFANKQTEIPAPQQNQQQQVVANTEVPHTITLDSIINKLNIIRSGKSLKKDDFVQGELADYFNKLSNEERKILYTFLKAIGSVMAGGTEGEVALSPQESGISNQEKQQQNVQQAAPPKEKVSVNNEELPPIRVKQR